MENKAKNEKLGLYECTSLFIDAMSNKFPDTSQDSAVFIAVTDGKKMSSWINGDDNLIRKLLAQVAITDEEIRNIIGDSLVAAIQNLKLNKHKDDTTTI